MNNYKLVGYQIILSIFLVSCPLKTMFTGCYNSNKTLKTVIPTNILPVEQSHTPILQHELSKDTKLNAYHEERFIAFLKENLKAQPRSKQWTRTHKPLFINRRPQLPNNADSNLQNSVKTSCSEKFINPEIRDAQKASSHNKKNHNTQFLEAILTYQAKYFL